MGAKSLAYGYGGRSSDEKAGLHHGQYHPQYHVAIEQDDRDRDQSSVIQALQEQILSTRRAWQRQIWELEGQVRDLKAEVEELRTAEGSSEYCMACGRGAVGRPSHDGANGNGNGVGAGESSANLLGDLSDELGAAADLEDRFFVHEVHLNKLAFLQQFQYAVFYSYIKLKEQEIRSLTWIAECIAQNARDRIHDFIPTF